MSSLRRAFIIMPFGLKKMPDGTEIDCDQVYKELLAPAIENAGLAPYRANADRRGGSIHIDMFMDLLLSEFVVADLTMDNANVWYEIGVRHALRAGGSLLVYSLRDTLPFDIANQRIYRYTLKNGRLDPDRLAADITGIVEAIEATLGAWRGRRTSPVYQTLPNLQEPDWKTLKVGAVNEYWEALDRWQMRIQVARRKNRPGDILVLADEVPNSILEFEALRTAGEALLSLRRPFYALSVVTRALDLNKDDLKARQLRGMALGQVGRYDEAKEELGRLAGEYPDGETLSILARIEKDQWTLLLDKNDKRKSDPRAAGVATLDSLEDAGKAYLDAFCADPNACHPGINALSLGRLWEDLSGRKSRLALPLNQIADGVGWAIAAANSRKESYWAYLTLGELELGRNQKVKAIYAYHKAAEMAVDNSDRFALYSACQQLELFVTLGFRADIAAEARRIVKDAEQLLFTDTEPARVVVFSGHMIDNPAVRGPGRQKPARFPAAKVKAAAKEIRARLGLVGATAGDLGLCSGASGGNLLFAEACLERNMRVELRMARETPQFLAESVTFADADHCWERAFDSVINNPLTTVLVMPEELGPAPKDLGVHDRCNRWILYSALSNGLPKVSYIALWDREQGGTQQMVDLLRKLTGRQPEIIDPATLPDEPEA